MNKVWVFVVDMMKGSMSQEVRIHHPDLGNDGVLLKVETSVQAQAVEAGLNFLRTRGQRPLLLLPIASDFWVVTEPMAAAIPESPGQAAMRKAKEVMDAAKTGDFPHTDCLKAAKEKS